MKKSIFILFLLSVFNTQAQTIPSNIPTNGLIGWYPFNSNANDESGGGNNGIVVGASLTSDRFGNANSAYYFNGTTDHISIPYNFFNIGSAGFTISCWLNTSNLNNPNNNNSNQCVFNTRPHTGLALDFNWGSSNKYSIWAGTNPSSSGWNIFSDAVSVGAVSTNVWNNMVMVKNNTTYYLYVNGVLDKTYTNSTAASNYFCKMVIGQTDSTVAKETFFGKLDDFGVWDRALSSAEIDELHQADITEIKTKNPSFYKLYPNPANNILTIESEKISQRTEVKIHNIIGEEVKREVIENNQQRTQIDLSNLINGVYFVNCTNGESSFTEKIIINK